MFSAVARCSLLSTVVVGVGALATPAMAAPLPTAAPHVLAAHSVRAFPGTVRSWHSRSLGVRALQPRTTVRAHGPVPSRVTATPSALGQRALQEAATHAGAPYQWGGNGPSSFDCSGFTRYVFGRLGHALPRTAQEQMMAVMPVANDAKRPGDLIFVTFGGQVGHVGIYAGGGRMWAATHTGDTVHLQDFSWAEGYHVGRVG